MTSRFNFVFCFCFCLFALPFWIRGGEREAKGRKCLIPLSSLLSPKSYGMPITQDTSLRHF